MKVGPHVMTHSNNNTHRHERDVVPRVGSAQSGGNLKLIQCQLMLLLHARRCQQRHEIMIASNRQPPVTNSVARAILLNCPIRHCRAMKDVLNHMKTCRLGAACTFQHCTTSLRILSHWTSCTIEECALCQCVRQRMKRAKEWEATLPRSSRYTLLAAALRSSQAPRPVPPNCNMAEQAQVGRSGVSCQSQAELRTSPAKNEYDRGLPTRPEGGRPISHISDLKKPGDSTKAAKLSIPSPDQVRKAYEQLGIPCPEEALKRLLATLPPSRVGPRRDTHQNTPVEMDVDDSDDDTDEDNLNHDAGVFDCSSPEPSPVPAVVMDSDAERTPPQSSPSLPLPRPQLAAFFGTRHSAFNSFPHKSSSPS